MPASALKFPPHAQRRPARLGRAPYLIRRDIRNSIAEGSAHSVMVGLGENYFPAFALAAGLGEVVAGLLATVPLLVGAVVQLASQAGVRALGSYRKWILICASMQCLSFVPFILCALWGKIPATAAFLFAGLYWGSGLGVGAAWNTWMGTVIPQKFRTRFFSVRNRFVQIAGMGGFLLGGVVLKVRETPHDSTVIFTIVFAIAFAARALSILFASRVSEPVSPSAHAIKNITFQQFTRCFRTGNETGRLLLYLLGVQLTVYIASPFFTPFMLTKCQLTYSQFTVLIATTFAAKILALPTLGKLVARYRAAKVLWFGGVGIVLNPLLWLFPPHFGYLIGVQLISGIFWGAWELCTVLLIMERINESERVGFITHYNLVNAALMVLGSMLGATLLDGMGKSVAAYHVLFAVSFGARALTLVLLRQVTIAPKLKWLPLTAILDFRRTGQLLTLPQFPKVFRKRPPPRPKKKQAA